MKQIKIDLNTPYDKQNENVKTKLCKHDFNEIVNLYNLKKRVKKGLTKYKEVCYNLFVNKK